MSAPYQQLRDEIATGYENLYKDCYVVRTKLEKILLERERCVNDALPLLWKLIQLKKKTKKLYEYPTACYQPMDNELEYEERLIKEVDDRFLFLEDALKNLGVTLDVTDEVKK